MWMRGATASEVWYVMTSHGMLRRLAVRKALTIFLGWGKAKSLVGAAGGSDTTTVEGTH